MRRFTASTCWSFSQTRRMKILAIDQPLVYVPTYDTYGYYAYLWPFIYSRRQARGVDFRIKNAAERLSTLFAKYDADGLSYEFVFRGEWEKKAGNTEDIDDEVIDPDLVRGYSIIYKLGELLIYAEQGANNRDIVFRVHGEME